ncbi:DUF3040 domain-containing protein [Spelaeicoccus albus]|uniref:DUF3040 family protein n=1 Tax=Spelaeicoccus albus TaxID=1280376 RepID=A0A7Z0IH75_9MICO|nr:DUF3040 domain-containing protein [Spelaeicoccus albus]NYI67580.1 hypothetical protein [Spelaeicoccus albus]
MISAKDDRIWCEVTAQLAADERRIEQTVRRDSGLPYHAGRWLRRWSPAIWMAAFGYAMAVVGSVHYLNLPVLGVCGIGILIGGYLLCAREMAKNAGWRERKN